jgi:hypothetical protein
MELVALNTDQENQGYSIDSRVLEQLKSFKVWLHVFVHRMHFRGHTVDVKWNHASDVINCGVGHEASPEHFNETVPVILGRFPNDNAKLVFITRHSSSQNSCSVHSLVKPFGAALADPKNSPNLKDEWFYAKGI